MLRSCYELQFLHKIRINWVQYGTANEHETYIHIRFIAFAVLNTAVN
jgi:hypothetical protein